MKSATLLKHPALNGYEFKVRSVIVELELGITRQHAIIVVLSLGSKRERVHWLTQFVFETWKYRKYNTQKKHATNLVMFMNWLLSKKDSIGINSLDKIDFFTGTTFINSLTTAGLSRETVKGCLRTLVLFYHFLFRKGLLKHYKDEDFKFVLDEKRRYLESPFKGVFLPAHVVNKQIAHMVPEEYILPFLEIVVQVANPIALGVYFQMFGGLRQGEAVNIQRNDLTPIGPYGSNGLIIKIKQKHLRTDIRDSSGASSVKKERYQLVYSINNWLENLYKQHLLRYEAKDGSDALFVNQDGLAMSGRSYRYYFDKAKKKFIERLTKSEDPIDKVNAIKLSGYKWSTHIGRGIFTNLLAENAENPYEIALPRGDSDLSSSLVYQNNTLRMKKNLEDRLNELYRDYIPKLLVKDE